MPLRVWRTDEVTPLSPHPNDPALPAKQGVPEVLTTFTVSIPEGTPTRAVEDAETREARRAKELAGHGHLPRLWILPGQGRAGPVASPRRRTDAGDREIAAPGPLDDHRDHAAHPAPERPGGDRLISGNHQKVAIITAAPRASAPTWRPSTVGRAGRWSRTP